MTIFIALIYENKSTWNWKHVLNLNDAILN